MEKLPWELVHNLCVGKFKQDCVFIKMVAGLNSDQVSEFNWNVNLSCRFQLECLQKYGDFVLVRRIALSLSTKWHLIPVERIACQRKEKCRLLRDQNKLQTWIRAQETKDLSKWHETMRYQTKLPQCVAYSGWCMSVIHLKWEWRRKLRHSIKAVLPHSVIILGVRNPLHPQTWRLMYRLISVFNSTSPSQTSSVSIELRN